MARFSTKIFVGLTALSWFSLFVPCLSAMPEVDQVLRTVRENTDKFNPLHVQLKYIEERTEAFGSSQAKQAAGIDYLVKQLEAGESMPELEKAFGPVNREQMIQHLKESAKSSRSLAKPVRVTSNYEFFVDGEDYQVRTLLGTLDDDGQAHAFPDVPLHSASLAKDYADVRIYSRSTGQTPVAQIWPGQSSPDHPPHAMNSSKDVGESQHLHFAPFASTMHPGWDKRHPIDTFLSAPANRYRVAGQEEEDGRLLTIVDVAVPTELSSGTIDENGQPQQVRTCYWYRAWLDMERGGIPIKMHFWYGTEGKPYDERFRAHPTRIMKTIEIKQLENGGWYPARTEEEEFNVDPSVPPLTTEQWKEVWAEKREAPPFIVFRRDTWECTNINTNDPGGDEFFVLNFSEGQKFFDLDKGKVIGALESKPSVKAGELAPAWNVARWLDGEQHTLDEFRGKVVVLDFWGLWCSACRSGTPALVALEEKFKDKPVVFVSIHTAEGDPSKLAERVAEYAAETGWKFLAAVDSGTMSEDSMTCHEYGCRGFPTQIVIGVDGLVTYNSDQPPAGLEDVFGKLCDEVTPEDEAKMNAYMGEQCKAAGETWPLPEGTSDDETIKVFNRVVVFMMSQQIEAALAERK